MHAPRSPAPPCHRKPAADPAPHEPARARAAAAPPADYLKKILTARVYDVAHRDRRSSRRRNLSRRLGNHVLLKREDQQPVFSFKLRGAYNKMAHLSADAAAARRDLRLGRQPRAGRRAGGAPAGLQGRDRDAGDHAAS